MPPIKKSFPAHPHLGRHHACKHSLRLVKRCPEHLLRARAMPAQSWAETPGRPYGPGLAPLDPCWGSAKPLSSRPLERGGHLECNPPAQSQPSWKKEQDAWARRAEKATNSDSSQSAERAGPRPITRNQWRRDSTPLRHLHPATCGPYGLGASRALASAALRPEEAGNMEEEPSVLYIRHL
ncbi:hypothetical protein P4O66_007580 [Electrophorus voltai]|uniref:Uncharacterized protein n=1 Tax=Electrophorus voltai TaxID=2609070 RepID=A0AAD8ZHL4_9TELE|nr:hypothetical protein P4O66_007580 [Electrophorus voltai]